VTPFREKALWAMEASNGSPVSVNGTFFCKAKCDATMPWCTGSLSSSVLFVSMKINSVSSAEKLWNSKGEGANPEEDGLRSFDSVDPRTRKPRCISETSHLSQLPPSKLTAKLSSKARKLPMSHILRGPRHKTWARADRSRELTLPL
jgi:hypothetical protein